MMKGNLHRITIVAALFAVLPLSACMKPKVAVDPSFWNNKETRVGVALVKYPEAAAHKAGAQGLLDMAINSVTAAELQAHMRTLTSDEFNVTRERFIAELKKRGIQARAVDAAIDLTTYGTFEKPEGTAGDFFDSDIRALAAKESLDLLVLLSIDAFGTIRPYYGFIPTGNPKGFCMASGRLVDLRNNRLLWATTSPEQESSVEAEGSWDQPPQYPELTAAMRKAIANAQEFLMSDFFAKEQAAKAL